MDNFSLKDAFRERVGLVIFSIGIFTTIAATGLIAVPVAGVGAGKAMAMAKAAGSINTALGTAGSLAIGGAATAGGLAIATADDYNQEACPDDPEAKPAELTLVAA